MTKGKIVISNTGLEHYSDCPRKWFYGHHPDIPKKTDYPRLFGIEIHRHIAGFYRPTREPRPFFYKDKKLAINAWFNRWQRALEKVTREEKLILPDEKWAKRYGETGAYCIAKYWDVNFNLPRPFQVEQYHRINLDKGIVFVGIFDQVREVSLDWILRHRPEIVENGKLASGYDNKVVVDLKTNYIDYDLRQFKEDPSLEEEIRWQYNLHENLQATSFTFLYEKKTGKKPVGFLWYHLRSGKIFFTFREDRDYQTLYGVIYHFLDNLSAQSFPKHVDKHCKFCDYLNPCREDRYFLVVEPEELGGICALPKMISNLVIKPSYRQLRLKLKVPREKRKEPQIVTTSKNSKKSIKLPAIPLEEEKLKVGQ